MAVYQGDERMYASYPCTYDGKGTFSFYLIYYVSEGYFAKGEERLVFESDADRTPLMAIDFDGIETTETGFKAPRLSFYVNEYVKSYKATVVSGDITSDPAALAGVRSKLIAGEAPGPYPVLTLYADHSELWSVPGGNLLLSPWHMMRKVRLATFITEGSLATRPAYMCLRQWHLIFTVRIRLRHILLTLLCCGIYRRPMCRQ